MTTTDQPLSIDDILNEPVQIRGWVIGPVTHVDRARRECKVSDRTGATVTVCYRSEDEATVLTVRDQCDEQSLKAFGLCEYQPGWIMTHLLRVELLKTATHEEVKRLRFHDLWQESWAAVDRSDWPELPSDLAENHDEYIARAISDG